MYRDGAKVWPERNDVELLHLHGSDLGFICVPEESGQRCSDADQPYS
jgi:hypothetical protein